MKNFIKLFLPRYQKIILEYKVDPKPRYGFGSPPHQRLYEIINRNRKTYEAFLEEILAYKDNLAQIHDSGNENQDTNPTWNNEFLPGLDIAALYTMIRKFKPETYIEIGSGNSTKVAFKAIQEGKLSTNIVSIDPHPRVFIDQLANEVIRKPFEDVTDLKPFSSLKPNDIVFIDNSHRCFPNSDVTATFLDLVPVLPKGVLLHFHDIYLPFDYPQFMCDRFYSEQYLLAMMLLANDKKYQTMMPNYFISEDPDLSKILHPLWQHPDMPSVEKHGGSFWIKITE